MFSGSRCARGVFQAPPTVKRRRRNALRNADRPGACRSWCSGPCLGRQTRAAVRRAASSFTRGSLPTIGRQAPTNEQNLIAATDPVLTTMAQWPLKIDLPGDRSAG